MRVLNFFRSDRVPSAAVKSAAAEDTLGVDAFASEAPATRRQGDAGSRAGLAKSPIVWALAALVIVETAPAALWVRTQLQKGGGTARTQPAAPPPASVANLAACEPVPAPGPAPSDAADAKAASAAATAGIAARAAAPVALAGSIAIEAPVPMMIFEGKRLVGTTEAETIMLSVGSHDLEFVSDEVGYRARRNIAVQAGRTTAVRLDAPRGSLSVNALPWAEIWIDNQRIGETPLGNVQQPIGAHEIVFRHPELGERRATVLVTLKEPARISMDLRKK